MKYVEFDQFRETTHWRKPNSCKCFRVFSFEPVNRSGSVNEPNVAFLSYQKNGCAVGVCARNSKNKTM